MSLLKHGFPRTSDLVDLGRVHEFAFLISSRMILMLLVQPKDQTLRNSVGSVS